MLGERDAYGDSPALGGAPPRIGLSPTAGTALPLVTTAVSTLSLLCVLRSGGGRGKFCGGGRGGVVRPLRSTGRLRRSAEGVLGADAAYGPAHFFVGDDVLPPAVGGSGWAGPK